MVWLCRIWTHLNRWLSNCDHAYKKLILRCRFDIVLECDHGQTDVCTKLFRNPRHLDDGDLSWLQHLVSVRCCTCVMCISYGAGSIAYHRYHVTVTWHGWFVALHHCPGLDHQHQNDRWEAAIDTLRHGVWCQLSTKIWHLWRRRRNISILKNNMESPMSYTKCIYNKTNNWAWLNELLWYPAAPKPCGKNTNLKFELV